MCAGSLQSHSSPENGSVSANWNNRQMREERAGEGADHSGKVCLRMCWEGSFRKSPDSSLCLPLDQLADLEAVASGRIAPKMLGDPVFQTKIPPSAA